jgi:LruC domain-containing protein
MKRPSISLFPLVVLAVCALSSAARAQAFVPSGPFILTPNSTSHRSTTVGIGNGFVAGAMQPNGSPFPTVWQVGPASCGAAQNLPLGRWNSVDDSEADFAIGDRIYGKAGLAGYWNGAQPAVGLTGLYGGPPPTAASADGAWAFFPGNAFFIANSHRKALGNSPLTGLALHPTAVVAGRVLAVDQSYQGSDDAAWYDLASIAAHLDDSVNVAPSFLPTPAWAIQGSCAGLGGTSNGNYILGTCSDTAASDPTVGVFVSRSFLWDMTVPSAPTFLALTGGGADGIQAVAMNDQYIVANGQYGYDFHGLAWSTSDLAHPVALPTVPAIQGWRYGNEQVTGISGSLVSGSFHNPGTYGNAAAYWDLSGAANCTSNPIANAGASQTLQLDSSGNVTIHLDGAGSTGAVSWAWYYGGSLVSTGEQATLSVNTAPGDSFFELAILGADGTGSSAFTRLTATLPPPPPTCSLAFSPSQGAQGMVLFEDNWPANGDLDFNDQVVTYNYQLQLNASGNATALQATFNILAAGADTANGLYLRLPGVAPGDIASLSLTDSTGQTGPGVTPRYFGNELVIPIIADTRSLFAAPGFINTSAALAAQNPTMAFSLNITFASPVSLSQADGPFDLFLAQTADYGHQIHLPAYSGAETGVDPSFFTMGNDGSNIGINVGRWFVNTDGLPFALNLNQPIDWPLERSPIDSAYPEITQFGLSAGIDDPLWFSDQVIGSAVFTQGLYGSQAPQPILLDQNALDASCTH